MKARRNFAGTLLAVCIRAAHWPAFVLLICTALAGCRHRVPPFDIPVAPYISIDPVDLQNEGILITPQSPPDFGPLPSINPPAPPQRRRSGPKEESASPAPAADEPAPADLAIGSLSSGTDATPQIQQQAQDMISSIRQSLGTLPARIVDAQKRQVRQVRHFLDQAQQALNTGDTEGAKNLATKAGLLMDDLKKK